MSADRRDLVILAAPWLRHSEGFRERVAENSGEIRTYDGGVLKLENGRWVIVLVGDLNEAKSVLADLT
jgi:hypothetical protein